MAQCYCRIRMSELLRDKANAPTCFEGERLYGSGVNVAARIERLAEPGSVCISGTVLEQVRGKGEHEFADLGHRKVKNIAEPVHGFALRTSGISLIALD